MYVNVGPVTAPSLTCPPQRYLGTSSQAFSVGKRGDTPDTSPHSTPLLPLNTSTTSMRTCIKKLLHSIPHTATYKKEFSLSLLSHQFSFSLPSLSFSAGTCNYLMPGRQVLSRGVRPGASWQLGMIRRLLEFCHWSPWCSPRRPGCLVVTATIATLNLLTGRNSSRPRWLCSPKQQALWGVERRTKGLGTGLLMERQNFCSYSSLCSKIIHTSTSHVLSIAFSHFLSPDAPSAKLSIPQIDLGPFISVPIHTHKDRYTTTHGLISSLESSSLFLLSPQFLCVHLSGVFCVFLSACCKAGLANVLSRALTAMCVTLPVL